jgi:hypothetical protein
VLAIVTSHNIIIVHNQLIRFPDIAFFVSPIPLHIAAMVILYGHMSRCDRIPRQVALEDVWMALDVLPSLRWRWERKDLNGGHPLIAKLAEKVLEVNLHQVGPPSHPILLCEQEWEKDAMTMASAGSGGQQQTPTQQNMTLKSQAGTNGINYPGGYSDQSTPKSQQPQGPQQLVDVPTELFYPFFPEKSNSAESGAGGAGIVNGPVAGGNGGFNHIFAAAAQPINEYGYHPSQDSFMLEEKDTAAVHPGMQIWMNNGNMVSFFSLSFRRYLITTRMLTLTIVGPWRWRTANWPTAYSFQILKSVNAMRRVYICFFVRYFEGSLFLWPRLFLFFFIITFVTRPHCTFILGFRRCIGEM